MTIPPAEVDIWTPIGPTRIDGPHVPATGVLFHIAIPRSQPSVIYVSSPRTGVWASEDHAATWRDASGDLPVLTVVGLAVDAGAPEHVYAAIGGIGVYESTDAGGSWVKVGAPPGLFPSITDLLVDPTNGQLLHVRAQNGIYRSVDGGASWQLSLAAAASHLVMAPNDPNVLYAGVPGLGVLRTRDGGASGSASWITLTPGLAAGVSDVRIALTAASASTIYARFRIATTVNQVYGTNNGGGTWTLRSKPDMYLSVIAADDTDAERVYIAGINFFRSDDGGVTWDEKGDVHVDHHAVASDPGQPADIYTACDGGLYRSTQADDWEFVADGIANVLFYDLAVSTTRPERAIGGTQDNGTIITDGSAVEWGELDAAGDGATVAIDPTDGEVMYAMDQYASSIMRSDDSGDSFTNIGAGLPPDQACPNLHFGLNPNDPSLLLACCGALWQTSVEDIAWTPIFIPPGAPGESVTVFGIGRDDVYYAATNTGRVYLGPGGDSWQLAFVHPADAAAADLIVDLDEPDVLYCAFTGGTDRVFRFQRNAQPVVVAAAGARPVADLSVGLLSGLGGAPGVLAPLAIGLGLPAGLGVNTLAVDAMRPLTIYAGTNVGVYRARSTDQAATWDWSDYNAGLPSADVRTLRVQATTGLMRAATFGRSAFQVNTDAPVGSLLNISGRLTFLRVHDVGTGFGRPPNQLDAEVILLLDSMPWLSFGFQLRADDEAPTRSAMLTLLRSAFISNRPVSIDFIRTAPRVGTVIRVATID
jgi:hypothetical protein